MTDEQKAAFINAQVACALIEMNGMLSSNAIASIEKQFPLYNKQNFMAIIDKYGIHHNAVLTTFRN